MQSINKISEEMIKYYLSISKEETFPKNLLSSVEKISKEYFEIKNAFNEILYKDSLCLFEKEKEENIDLKSFGINECIVFASVFGKSFLVIKSPEAKKIAFPAIRISFTVTEDKNVNMFFDMPYDYKKIEDEKINIEVFKLMNFVKEDFTKFYESNLEDFNNKIRKVYYLGEIFIKILKEKIKLESVIKEHNFYSYNQIIEKVDIIKDYLLLNKDVDISEKINKFKELAVMKNKSLKLEN